METRDKFVMSVAFSPDGKWVASGGLDGLVNIFDVGVGTDTLYLLLVLEVEFVHLLRC